MVPFGSAKSPKFVSLRRPSIVHSRSRLCSMLRTLALQVWDRSKCCLIGLGENDAARGGLAGENAFAGFFGKLVGDAANGCFGFRGNAVFRFPRSSPVSQQKTALLVNFLFEIVPSID